MSREALQESLSAVMDNEADELELRRVLNAIDDAETRATWSRYQVARAAMHHVFVGVISHAFHGGQRGEKNQSVDDHRVTGARALKR